MPTVLYKNSSGFLHTNFSVKYEPFLYLLTLVLAIHRYYFYTVLAEVIVYSLINFMWLFPKFKIYNPLESFSTFKDLSVSNTPSIKVLPFKS